LFNRSQAREKSQFSQDPTPRCCVRAAQCVAMRPAQRSTTTRLVSSTIAVKKRCFPVVVQSRRSDCASLISPK
jgi:hypothetical protein